MRLPHILCQVVLLGGVASSAAYSVVRVPSSPRWVIRGATATASPPTVPQTSRRFVLAATAEEEADANADPSRGDEEDASAGTNEATSDSSEEDPAPPAEDPEVVALQEQIAALEAKVMEVRRQVSRTSDEADEYSRDGYARRVAEMENMRRTRSRLNSSSRTASTANLLTKFLPVLDRLEDLSAKYADDAFGKQYNALPGIMRTAMSEMGVVEYQVKEGDAMDAYRMEVTASEHSETVPAQTVLRVETHGLELEGNVMRKPKVVVSLGPELSLAAGNDSDAGEGDSPSEGTQE